MPSLNKAFLMGHVGKDPEIKYTQSGIAKAGFSLATSYGRKKEDGSFDNVTTWHNIVVWGNAAERCSKIHKGDLVHIEGRIDNRSYDDKEGNKRYVSEVIADRVQWVRKPNVQGESKEEDDDSPF